MGLTSIARSILGLAEKPVVAPAACAAAAAAPEGRRLLVASVRDEGPWLLEWLAYHRAIGFDDIWVWSNDNTDGSDALLAALDARGIIRHRPNRVPPGSAPQLHAYNLTLEGICARLSDAGNYGRDPVRTARIIRVTTEGTWLDMMTMAAPYSPDEAMATVRTVAALCFPNHFTVGGLK